MEEVPQSSKPSRVECHRIVKSPVSAAKEQGNWDHCPSFCARDASHVSVSLTSGSCHGVSDADFVAT